MVVTTQFSVETILDDLQLNGFESGDQFGSTVQALSGGGFAVVYGNHFNTTDTLAVSIYSDDGIPVQTATGTYVLPYSGSALGVQMSGDPVIAENADGSILLRWNSDDGSFGHGTDLFTASVDPVSGTIVRPQALVQNSTEIGNMALTIGSNGNQYTLYQDATFESLDLSRKNPDGSHIAISSIGDHFKDYESVDIVTLADGRLLIAATAEGTGDTNPIYVQFRTGTGQPIGSYTAMTQIDLVGPSDADTDIKLAALPDGGFAIAYAGEVDGEAGVLLRIFTDLDTNPDGIGPIRVDANLAAVESAVDIVALVNGWVAVSWTEANADGGTDILARVFDDTGTPLTEAFLVSSGETDADDSSLAALANGSVVVSWTDAQADSDGTSIQGKILAAGMDITGDQFANSLLGGPLDDKISGGGGDDSINGYGGDDLLHGQGGNDTIDGDLGNDRLTGGEGHDSLYGWSGNDTLVGGRGDDTLLGELGNDRLFGGDGSDQLFGGAGNDYLNPGNTTGADYVQPGTGNDTIDFSDLASPDAYVEIDNYGLSSGVTVTIDGATNTGSIGKGAEGTTTFLDINQAMAAENGGAGIYGTIHNDTFNIAPTKDGFLLIMGMHGNDVFNILNGEGLIRLGSSWWNATTGIVIDLSTGIVSEDGYGGQDTIIGVENLREVRTSMMDDSVLGSAGNDQVILMAGNDTADGGAGFDVLRYDRPGVEAVNVNLQTGVATGTWRGETFNHSIKNFEEVRGSREGDDTIVGGDGQNNWIEGRGGNDSILGGYGSDTLLGESGNDSLYGGNQDDTLDGGDGDDRIWGGLGRDKAYLGDGNDVFNDEAQNDQFGGDKVYGGSGNDTINGGGGHDQFRGNDGADRVSGGVGNDTLYGGNQNDTLHGGDGHDRIWGGLGRDDIFMGNGDDVFTDEAQNDQFGRDKVYGGSGNDTINGGGGNDEFRGNAGADQVSGGTGNDTLYGGSQDDTIIGGDGDDHIWGGLGRDRIFMGDGNDVFTDEAQNDQFGRDRVYGGDGNDTINGGGGDDTISGGDGDDHIWGGLGRDTIFMGNGNDVFTDEAQNDQFGRDTVYAGSGNDTINGGGGDDVIYGGAGGDDLRGGSGTDSLNGGAGNDTLSGGADADVLIFSSGEDQVIGFGPGDRIVLSGVSEITDFADLQANHLSGGADAVIDDGEGNTMTLVGVAEGVLDVGDFIF
ncbi:calcium-binding protein [Ruegeria jejuensis]|uniref:calcium-binding protein n=1 Tax=Ruegeria jejuensis TaxID=3233338 RepID=UPI00355B40F2